jgi:c-di-GMP-binding flagellar brake protein YcgR
MKDRRKHKRYYLKALLQKEGVEEYSNVTLESINISAGGLLMRSSDLIEVGEKFSLLFSLPGRQQTIGTTCEAVHNLEAIPGKQYFIGAKFLELDGISREELDAYLQSRYDETPSDL